ncbi:hypothetical protein CFAM422_006290 [Trichoderma lentiforme]|uniref:Uncharacterized protein n=1 Tax=Trichoderma lentiforme TaxID=1567552 RepID=A0A9P4XDQ0_9HYPO|nr:hypothetical protein CFAM422_006290 [Trichoderma lentiforme]
MSSNNNMVNLLREMVATVRENAGGAGRGGASATTPNNHRMSTVVFITGTKANNLVLGEWAEEAKDEEEAKEEAKDEAKEESEAVVLCFFMSLWHSTNWHYCNIFSDCSPDATEIAALKLVTVV